ncbi:MAG: CBS domain-containing protein [Gemmatimonadota bacterium]|nr:CBS domain-containing protein [Gemmatimonadota bacterium]
MATVQRILDVKGAEVVTCGPDDTVLDSARRMNEHGIGGVVVVDDGSVVGVFTERDVLRRVVAARRDPETTRLREVMSTPVITCALGTQIDECRAIVTARRVRHLPVVKDGALCGLITSGDILAHQLREQQEAIDYLNSWVHEGR